MVCLCVTCSILSIEGNTMYRCAKELQGIAIIVMAVLCLFTIDCVGQTNNYNVWLLSSGDIIDFNTGRAVITEAGRSISNRNWLRGLLNKTI